MNSAFPSGSAARAVDWPRMPVDRVGSQVMPPSGVNGPAPDQLVRLEPLRRLRPERFTRPVDGRAAAEQEQSPRLVAADRGEDRPAVLQMWPDRPLLVPGLAEVRRTVERRQE